MGESEVDLRPQPMPCFPLRAGFSTGVRFRMSGFKARGFRGPHEAEAQPAHMLPDDSGATGL